MAKNYVLLETVTVGAGGAASITFNNIPQTGYTDLVIKTSLRSDQAIEWVTVKINGATTNTSARYIQGNGTGGTYSGTSTAGQLFTPNNPANWTSNTFTNNEFYFPNYANSTTYKSFSIDGVNEYNSGAADIVMTAGLWSSTSPITSITILGTSYNFVQYSTASLYGVAAVGTTPTKAPKALGGDIIQTDGTYWYHAFLGSSTFTPQTKLTCDVLVVAGGGGGGRFYGGGGGAGGLYAFTSQALTPTAYTVTIGAGGSGNGGTSATNPMPGTNGNDSQFGSLTLVKGGGYGNGGSGGTNNGGNGGSGGGAGGVNAGTGGSATGGQGYAGGNTPSNSGGGGGGAGAIGTAGSGSGISGAGGVGSSAYSSWGSVTGTGENVGGTYYFAGGGGGSGSNGPSGGSGGGGRGATDSVDGATGTANTGGGGGGGSFANPSTFPAKNGGSGIVIVRYPVAG